MESRYLELLQRRFADHGLALGEWPSGFVARHVRYDIVATPCYVEDVFVCREFDCINKRAYEEFAATCWEYASQSRTPVSTFYGKLCLPSAARYIVGVVNFVLKLATHWLDLHRMASALLCVYPVAVAQRVDPALIDWVRLTLPSQHQTPASPAWSIKMVPAIMGLARASALHELRDACSFVIPCIFCEDDGRLDHFQRVPILGNAFYREFKKVIKQRLAL